MFCREIKGNWKRREGEGKVGKEPLVLCRLAEDRGPEATRATPPGWTGGPSGQARRARQGLGRAGEAVSGWWGRGFLSRGLQWTRAASPWPRSTQFPLGLGIRVGFFRQEYWSRLPFPPLGDLPNSGIEPTSLAYPALAGRFFTTDSSRKPSLFLDIRSKNFFLRFANAVDLYCLHVCWKQ